MSFITGNTRICKQGDQGKQYGKQVGDGDKYSNKKDKKTRQKHSFWIVYKLHRWHTFYIPGMLVKLFVNMKLRYYNPKNSYLQKNQTHQVNQRMMKKI